MNNKIVIGIILLIVVIGAIFFFPKKTSSPTQTATQQTQTVVSPNTISIKDFAFSPDSLTVKAGTKVTWVNNDSVTHTVKSDTFNSSDIPQSGTFEFTFTTPGTFDYSCGIHPSMTGKVIVE